MPSLPLCEPSRLPLSPPSPASGRAWRSLPSAFAASPLRLGTPEVPRDCQRCPPSQPCDLGNPSNLHSQLPSLASSPLLVEAALRHHSRHLPQTPSQPTRLCFRTRTAPRNSS